MTINDWCRKIHKWAVRKGFWQEPHSNIGEKIALIHSELLEFLEAIRTIKSEKDEHCPEFFNYEIELADAVIRIFDLAGRFPIDLEKAIAAKMKANEKRKYKHGKKF